VTTEALGRLIVWVPEASSLSVIVIVPLPVSAISSLKVATRLVPG
jgi:hypothetical protein